MHGLRYKITASFAQRCGADLEHPKQHGDTWQLARHKAPRIRQPGARPAVRGRGQISPVCVRACVCVSPAALRRGTPNMHLVLNQRRRNSFPPPRRGAMYALPTVSSSR
jgi:hypothetical protein